MAYSFVCVDCDEIFETRSEPVQPFCPFCGSNEDTCKAEFPCDVEED